MLVEHRYVVLTAFQPIATPKTALLKRKIAKTPQDQLLIRLNATIANGRTVVSLGGIVNKLSNRTTLFFKMI